jgi:hypothetical protein
VVAAGGEEAQDFDGPVFGDRCGVLDGHRCDRWPVQSVSRSRASRAE